MTDRQEEFIADEGRHAAALEAGGHADDDYEELIEPLLAKTLRVPRRGPDRRRPAGPTDRKVLLVGGATRHSAGPPSARGAVGAAVHAEIEPDLAVAMGAAVQGGLIAGVDVGPVLVDITPHTLGIQALGDLDGMPPINCFSPIIPRNTPLPAARTEMYTTVFRRPEGG